MTDRFEWLEQEILYEESRGGERRWALTREVIRDRESGATFERALLRHPGVAAIVPITAAGEVLLIEQFRYSTARPLWEIPAGTLHGEWRDGRMISTEDPVAAAARELSEEAGLAAARLELAQQFYVMPGTSDGLVHLFLAFDLSAAQAEADEGEIVTRVRAFPIKTAQEMIGRGEICDAKTIIGINCAQNFLEQERL